MRAPGSGVARVWSSIATRWRAMQRGQCRGRKCGRRGAMTSLQRGHFTAGWSALRVTAEDHPEALRARPTCRLSREGVEDERLVRRRRFVGRPTRAASGPRLAAGRQHANAGVAAGNPLRRCGQGGWARSASSIDARGSIGVSGARSVRGSAGTARFMPPRRVSGSAGAPAVCSFVSTRPAGP
jgi:hypothetical protein